MDVITWKKEEQPNMRRTKNLKTWILPRSRQQRTMGQNQGILRHGIIHFPTSEGVSKVSERENEWAQRRAREASSPKKANEWAVQANERADERVAQYLRLNSCLFQTIVRRLDVPLEMIRQLWWRWSGEVYYADVQVNVDVFWNQ